MLLDGLWGPSQICTRSGLLWGPLRARPRAGAAGVGGVPRAACFPQRVMFGNGPAPPVAMETKQGRWRRPERGRAGPEWGKGRWGSRAVALVTGTEAPLCFIRVTACPPVPQVFPVWPPAPGLSFGLLLSLVSLSSFLISSTSLTTVLDSPSSSQRRLPDSKFS